MIKDRWTTVLGCELALAVWPLAFWLASPRIAQADEVGRAPVLGAAVQDDGHKGHDLAEEEGNGLAEGASTSHSAPNPLAVDPDLAVWTAIVFLLLLLVLGKFAWGPIVAALEKREQSIKDHIRAAEAQHEEAKLLLAQHEKKLAGASEEVRQLIEAARRDGEQLKGQILAEAKAAASTEHERAMRDVRQATDAALKEISEASANFAVELARKIVQRELTSADHQRLVREAVTKFPSVN